MEIVWMDCLVLCKMEITQAETLKFCFEYLT